MISSKILSNKDFKAHVIQVLNHGVSVPEMLPVSTDSRNSLKNSCFFAIKGERHDAFHFLEEKLQDFPVVIFEHNLENANLALTWAKKYLNTQFISVKNSVQALQILAHLHVQNWYNTASTHHLIAISGSNGKTTTKEMLYFLLSSALGGSVTATQKNNNNHIGVPLTLFQIHCKETQVAVVEFGSNHPGEMKVICDIATPNIGVVTNVGHTHMEFFSTLEDVFKEEGLIYDAVMSTTNGKGLFLINEDDELLKKLPSRAQTKKFSCVDKNADCFYDITGHRAQVNLKNIGEFTLLNSNIMGKHNFVNLCNAFSLSCLLFPNKTKEFIRAAQNFLPTPNRSEWKHYKQKEVFLDAYNANPSSMKVSLESFIQESKEQGLSLSEVLIVVGEMKELGPRAASYHEEFSKWLASLGSAADIIYVGGFHEEIRKNCSWTYLAHNVDEAKKVFEEKLKNKKKCFIKASRSLQLERLLDITKG
jgi:UDP-N-acetylmuramoyl-tripeptide--D-alanyl-D-alanine ligase